MSEEKYTADAIFEALCKSEYGRDYDYDAVDWYELTYSGGEAFDTDAGVLQVVDTQGGHEGEGEHAHIVICATETDQYFRIDGYYSSYEGTEWDGELREVQLVERMVKFYE